MEDNYNQKEIIDYIANKLECTVDFEYNDITPLYKNYSEWAQSFIMDSLLSNNKIRRISVYLENNSVKKLRIICTDYPNILYHMRNKNSFNELLDRYQIPDKIEELSELNQLDICTIGVRITEKIWNLQNLKRLYVYCPCLIGGNEWIVDTKNIKELALIRINEVFDISKLFELEKLDLGGSEVLFLPDEYYIHNIKLKEIHLSGSLLQQLPSSLYKLQFLEVLNLEATPIRILSYQIGWLKNLRKLYLNGTDIRVLPDTLVNCINLEVLTLPQHITKLPIKIGKLNKLKVLDLERTKIEVLPESIAWLHQITRLKVPNTLTCLPEYIGQLQELESLDLKYTKIKNLPDSIGDLIKIKRLDFPEVLETLPGTIGNLKRLTILNLKYTKIRLIPDSIGCMSQLTQITFPETLCELPETIALLKKIKCLDLSKTQIKKLPEGIGGMESLEYLEFPEDITIIPQSIGRLTQLKKMDFSNTKAKKLPESIGRLEQINQLMVPKTLVELPHSIGGLCKIEILDLKYTEIKTLPEEISDLTNIEKISFPYQLERLPEAIGKLYKIKCFDLRDTKVKKIPDSINYMANLEEMYMPYTLEVFPNTIGQLKKLKIINLEGTKIKKIPADIGENIALEYLKLSRTPIEKIPDSIGELKSLKELYLDYSRIEEIPSGICKIKGLKRLLINNSNLNELPENIGELEQLEILDISNTNISKLPDSIESFSTSSLKKLNIKGLKLDYISKGLASLILNTSTQNFYSSDVVSLNDVEILNQDVTLFQCPREVIRAFYSAPLVRLNECKTIFLGDGNVGKSSLIDCIIGENFQINRAVTNGISIRKWYTSIDNKSVKIRFWDFGGQEIIHTMHLCFLTSRTIYVIVLDSRQDQYLEKIAIDWLQTVKSFAPQAPVILVLNKCDMNPMAMLNLASLKESFPQLVDCIRTSALTGSNIDGLRELIKYTIKKYSSYSVVFNEKWQGLKVELENMEHPYISNKTFMNLCKKYEIEDEALQINLLHWFSDLGVAYHYSGYDFEGHPDAINVLNPEWVTNGISRLILRTKTENGLVSHEAIYNVMSHSFEDDVNPFIIYTKREVNFILDVMRQKGMSLKLGNKELIPTKLNYFSPSIDHILGKETKQNLHFAIKGDYLPLNIIHKLVIERIKEVDFRKIWRNGVCLWNEDLQAKAVIILRYDSRYRLDIYIQSKDPTLEKEFLNILRDNILRIMDTLNIKKYEELICYQLDFGRKGEEPYLRVWKPYLKGIKLIYLPSSDSYVSPEKLLNVIYTDQQIINERKKEEMTVNNTFYNYGSINNSEISVGNSYKKIDKELWEEYSEKINEICRIDQISEVKYNYVIELLGQLLYEPDILKIQKEQLEDIIDNKDQDSGWKKIKNFLSDTANLVTILGTIPTIIEKICSLLLS